MLSARYLDALQDPVLLRGGENLGYRDPTAIYVDGRLHLFFTLVETEADGGVYMYVAKTDTADLVHFSPVRKLTCRDKSRNFSSPGSVITFDNKYLLCVQTYCRERGEKYGNERCRLFTMESSDLESFSEPQLLRVLGDDVSEADMGRMIDPYIVADAHEPGKWWCFFKQNGAGLSWTRDMEHWTFFGRVGAGENVCVLSGEDGYTMFHSPKNGIGVMHSADLVNWTRDRGVIRLGQDGWDWARGRITAGFVADLRNVDGFGRYVMFYHGSGPDDEEIYFDTYASLGVAWSDDLRHWEYPQQAAL